VQVIGQLRGRRAVNKADDGQYDHQLAQKRELCQ
jgi:hypothetical protein